MANSMDSNNVTMLWKQGVALTGRKTTVPPWRVCCPTACAAGGAPARPPAELQTTDDDDRRQRAKQYWPIRRASNNFARE